MTYYKEQVARINKQHYDKDYLTTQAIEAKHFMDTHFADDIDLDRIAKVALISKFHFIRVFKSLYGTTPGQYLTSVRIEKAKKMLLNGNAIADICVAVGYSSIPNFTNLFKSITGCTPALFQKNKKAISSK